MAADAAAGAVPGLDRDDFRAIGRGRHLAAAERRLRDPVHDVGGRADDPASRRLRGAPPLGAVRRGAVRTVIFTLAEDCPAAMLTVGVDEDRSAGPDTPPRYAAASTTVSPMATCGAW